ncbi:MAG: type 1 glutamine amidotransferase [Pirellulales bacterium]
MKPVLVFRHAAKDGLGTLAGIFGSAGVPFRYLDLFAELPAAFRTRDWAGLVVLGGSMNSDETEKHPFLVSEVAWIRQAVDAGLPVLGICLGCQLLAQALGARVLRHACKEIGWYEWQPLPAAADDPLLSSVRPGDIVFHWHGDTFELPPGAVQLVRGASCEQQAFRFGRQAWGLQCHLEVTPEIVDEWITSPGGCRELAELPDIDPAAIWAELPRRLPTMHALGERVFGAFAKRCAAAGG